MPSAEEKAFSTTLTMSSIPEMQSDRKCRRPKKYIEPCRLLYLFVLMVNFNILYLFLSRPGDPSESTVLSYRLKCPDQSNHTLNTTAPPSHPPPTTATPLRPAPTWSTKEEQEVLKKNLKRWRFSAGICEGCWQNNYKRVINPSPCICAPWADGTNPKLLILISTIHKHREYRDIIRATWGSYTKNNTAQARHVFLLGRDPGGNITDDQLLQDEGAEYGDILQDDYNSTYRRGGEIQLIMGYRWVIEQCSNVTHIIKVSDDTYLNIPQVLKLIANTDLSNSVYGAPIYSSPPIRNPKNKWYTSPHKWPAPKYPGYVVGYFIGVTMPVLRKILLVSPYVAWSAGADDVIVGLCAQKMNIRILGLGGMHSRWHKTHPCHLKGDVHVIHIHGHLPNILRYMWERRDCFIGGKVHIGPKGDPEIYDPKKVKIY